MIAGDRVWESAEIVGREPELSALREFLSGERPARGLALSGGPGIGKTTLWEAGIALARRHGMHVLAARPSSAESRMPFAALLDLLGELDPAVFDALPAPQRVALDVALLRSDPGDRPPEPRAIALGLLNVLRALAAGGPLLVAVDDVQWLDPSSSDALAFASRRLGSEPVGFLLARRAPQPTPLELAVEGDGLDAVAVGPLSLGAARRLLTERLGLSLHRPLLRHVVEATLGNPLFVLEVGRSLAERGVPAPGEDIPVPAAVEDLLGSRVAALPADQQRALLTVALGGGLHEHELAEIAGHDAVDDAVRAGLLVVDGDRVRAGHPLLAAAAKERSRRADRRELHGRLAATLADEPRRALHLALATDRPDRTLAVRLERAAHEAAARGARRQAVRLAEHALRLTPADAPERPEHLLALATHLDRAGEARRLTDLLAPVIDELPAGSLRARGWLLLSEGAGPRTVPDVERHLDRALAETGDDPALRAHVLANKASNAAASAIARIHEAEGWAREALSLSAGTSREVPRLALYGLSWTLAMAGLPIDGLCDRSRALSDSSAYLAPSPERIAAQRLVWRGRIEEARAALELMLALADERGEPASYALTRLHLCELDLRTGDWASAERRLDEWAESSEGELLIRPMYERCRALLAAGLGRVGDAREWAADAIARGEVTGSHWDRLEALRARGMAAIAARELGPAVDDLRTAWAHIDREVGEPGVFPVAPELVEALVDLGELDEARAVTERLALRAEQHEHPWALVTVRRCRGLLALAAPDHDAAGADALAYAAAEYGRMGLHFDRARCLLSAGRAQRRAKQWGGARESLEAAVAAFEALGSDGWAERTRSELARVGGRRPRASGELTPTERDIVGLAAGGQANKEIARALHLAVHTVEVHLSRAYRKLGVRSRNQLAGRLAELGA